MRIDSDHPFFTRINIKLARIELELQRAEMAAAAWRDNDGAIREVSEVALAACLHHAYNGIESILEDVAKEFDGSVANGDTGTATFSTRWQRQDKAALNCSTKQATRSPLACCASGSSSMASTAAALRARTFSRSSSV